MSSFHLLSHLGNSWGGQSPFTITISILLTVVGAPLA